MGQGMKTQTSCSIHFWETQMLQNSTDIVKVKDLMDIFPESKCTVRTINNFYPLFLVYFLTGNSWLCSLRF